MAVAAMAWVRRNVGIYIDNATAARDYRSQLRGIKAFLLWGCYLLILILIALWAYSDIANRYDHSVALVQGRLRDFYATISIVLAALISAITPAMTASTITTERQRKSLDLIFSAPVEPKKLLVGKMISCYRYTWMLLILSLPITAVCVVMGGATWSDVLSLYMMLSCCGLIFTAFGLLMSSVCKTTPAAVCWSYVIIVFYLMFTTTGAAAGMAASGFYGANASNEGPWVAGLNPFFAVYAAPTHTMFWGVAVPNWVIVAAVALAISRLILLGAASQLSLYRSADTKNLRISGLIYAFALSVLYGWQITKAYFSMASLGPHADAAMGAAVEAWALALLIFIPNMSCFGSDGGRRHRNDGRFKVANTLVGTPSGALPYVALLALSVIGGNYCGALLNGLHGGPLFLAGSAWTLSFLMFWWAASRWLSARTSNLKGARMAVLAAVIVLLGLPFPVLAILQTSANAAASNTNFMYAQLLYPLAGEEGLKSALPYVFVLFTLALLLILFERTSKPPRQVYGGQNE